MGGILKCYWFIKNLYLRVCLVGLYGPVQAIQREEV